ncbi:MAG: hypothetical protein SGARI_004705, partial [Bacillariaceae sp.]
MYGAAYSFPNAGSYWGSPLASAQQAFVTPNKADSSAASTKKATPYPKNQSNANSVFDENNELKNRIAELEAELGLDAKPCKGKKVSDENARSDNVKPDKCYSVTTPVKKCTDESPKMFSPMKDLNEFDRRWIAQFEELKDYQKTHGHNMVPAAFGKLGRWVSRQRQEYKKDKLPVWRIKELEEIEF